LCVGGFVFFLAPVPAGGGGGAQEAIII
jgi:hypothetical protein